MLYLVQSINKITNVWYHNMKIFASCVQGCVSSVFVPYPAICCQCNATVHWQFILHKTSFTTNLVMISYVQAMLMFAVSQVCLHATRSHMGPRLRDQVNAKDADMENMLLSHVYHSGGDIMWKQRLLCLLCHKHVFELSAVVWIHACAIRWTQRMQTWKTCFFHMLSLLKCYMVVKWVLVRCRSRWAVILSNHVFTLKYSFAVTPSLDHKNLGV